jgi:hypothetical protein
MTYIIGLCLLLLSLFPGEHCLSISRTKSIDKISLLCQQNRQRTLSRSVLYSTIDAKDKEVVTIKLPIIQIFKTNAITGEFVCGNEMTVSIDKFQSTLKSLERDAQKDESSGNYGVGNIYSEDQLTNILTSTKDYVVLKLFRVGCKKCEKLEPIFDGLARDPVYSRFQFLQADVAYVDTYKKNLKDRLMGMRIGQAELPKD